MEPTDLELMQRVRRDDLKAFGELVQRHRAPLRRFLASLLPDPSLADDCAQETFLRLWLARHQYVPSGRFAAYLYQIARHYALNQRTKRVVPTAALTDSLTDKTGEPEQIVVTEWRTESIRKAIRDLPPIYRDVFESSHLDGLKYAEIACCLGIPLGTVKSRMAEAVRRLRIALAATHEGD